MAEQENFDNQGNPDALVSSVAAPAVQPDSMPIVASQQTNKPLLTNSLKVGLFIFLISSSLVLYGLPRLDHTKSSTPSFGLFLITGLIMIGLTTLFFVYLGRLRLGFGLTATILALGVNSVIAVIKFILSPYALYLANKHSSFSTGSGDPNSMIYYILVAVFILGLYIIVFRLVYMYYLRRQNIRQGKPKAKSKGISFKTASISLTGLLIAAVVLLGIGVIFLPMIFIGVSLSYISYVFGALGIPLLIAIALAIFMAYKGFGAVEKKVIISGDATLLASFFWVGLSLIVLYHIMWIIFMLTLIHIWPFNTYTPK